MKEKILYLILSVSLSTGRNITSKKTAADTNSSSQFFLSQTIIFASASLLLLVFGVKEFISVSVTTLIYGIIYGILLVLSQWMFTVALKNGNTSVCTVVYSLGFILPTISGTLFWKEQPTLLNFIGILVAVIIILLTAKNSETEQKKKNRLFILYILIAMISSGGLGIVQKVQQSSYVAYEKGAFLIIAFLFAFGCSFIGLLFHRERLSFAVSKIISPAITGACFGGANFCNTILAGQMKSAIFFPLQNISTILFTTLSGIFIFKERLTPKTIVILILGIVVVVLFSM